MPVQSSFQIDMETVQSLYLMRCGTHEMSGVREVNGEATEASSSEREIPVWALFKAWQQRMHITHTHSYSLPPTILTMLLSWNNVIMLSGRNVQRLLLKYNALAGMRANMNTLSCDGEIESDKEHICYGRERKADRQTDWVESLTPQSLAPSPHIAT